jgi:acetyl esterase
VERAFLRALLALPPGALGRITRPPAGADSPMDPHVQLVLALRRLRGYPGLTRRTPEATRTFMRQQALLARTRATPVGAVSECTVDGHAGPLRARHYAPPEPTAGAPPLLLYFHGGGFVSGDLDVLDEACRLLCRHAGAQVLSVSYRLAPEHPFPAAVEDAVAAYRWARRQASALGADPDRIAIGGDSSGANLATVVCHLAAVADEPMPAAQLLLYPPTHYAGEWASRDAYADGFLLTADDISFFFRHYRAGFDPDDFRHSPLRGTVLDRLPAALVVTAAMDPMRDEGEAYADALHRAGVQVDRWRVPGMPHAFVNLTTLSPAAHDATVEVARRLARLMAGASTMD